MQPTPDNFTREINALGVELRRDDAPSGTDWLPPIQTFACNEFIAELEGALRSSSPDRHVRILRQVTGLLLSCSDRLSEQQIGIFDDVLVRLIRTVDARPLAALSVAVADLPSAPREALRRLAFHEDAAIASPILLRSDCLSERDLIEIAARQPTASSCDLRAEGSWRGAYRRCSDAGRHKRLPDPGESHRATHRPAVATCRRG